MARNKKLRQRRIEGSVVKSKKLDVVVTGSPKAGKENELNEDVKQETVYEPEIAEVDHVKENESNMDDEDNEVVKEIENNCPEAQIENNCPEAKIENNCPEAQIENNCPEAQIENNCPEAQIENKRPETPKGTTMDLRLILKSKELLDMVKEDGSKSQKLELANAVYDLITKSNKQVHVNETRQHTRETDLSASRILELHRQYLGQLKVGNQVTQAKLANAMFHMIKGHLMKVVHCPKFFGIVNNLFIQGNYYIKCGIYDQLKDHLEELAKFRHTKGLLLDIYRYGHDKHTPLIEDILMGDPLENSSTQDESIEQSNVNAENSQVGLKRKFEDFYCPNDYAHKKLKNMTKLSEEEKDHWRKYDQMKLKELSDEEKVKVAGEWYEKAKGSLFKILPSLHLMNIAYNLYKCADKSVKDNIYAEFVGHFIDLKKSRIGKFIVYDVMKNGTPEQRKQILSEIPLQKFSMKIKNVREKKLEEAKVVD